MNFYLMRHGQAEAYAASDADRCLTSSGKHELERFLKALSPDLQDVDLILHSPYQRAFETALIVSTVLGVDSVQTLPHWTPEASPSLALASLESFENKTPLVVTHLPLVGYVTALCCQGSEQYPLPFTCGEIVKITADWPAAGLGQLLQNWRPV